MDKSTKRIILTSSNHAIFQASAAVQSILSLFWDVTRRISKFLDSLSVPYAKVELSKKNDSMTLEDGTHTLSQNVGK
jgi:hypothetical protein